MANRKAYIYERLQLDGQWVDRRVRISKLRPDGTLNPKDDRPGHFRVSWYDGSRKVRHPEVLKTLAAAVDVRAAKERRPSFWPSRRSRPILPVPRCR